MVSHEKPGTITIDEIRDQVINDIDIRPYYSPYKIYIIADADLMTPQAQNALLKTIEEPPEYAVILLLTNNIGGLLPTIQSRCTGQYWKGKRSSYFSGVCRDDSECTEDS